MSCFLSTTYWVSLFHILHVKYGIKRPNSLSFFFIILASGDLTSHGLGSKFSQKLRKRWGVRWVKTRRRCAPPFFRYPRKTWGRGGGVQTPPPSRARVNFNAPKRYPWLHSSCVLQGIQPVASCIVRGRLYKVPTTHFCNFCMCPMYSAAFEFDCNIFCTKHP